MCLSRHKCKRSNFVRFKQQRCEVDKLRLIHVHVYATVQQNETNPFFVYLKEQHFSKPQSASENIHPSIFPLGISCMEVAEAALVCIPAVKGQDGHTLYGSDTLKDTQPGELGKNL